MKVFFAPNGKPITSTSAVSFNSPNIEVDEHTGTAGLGPFADFPRFYRFTIPGLGACLWCIDSNEWLEQHCRLIEVSDDFDVWSDDGPPAWDDHIVHACSRVQHVGNVLWCVEKLRRFAPKDIAEDPTINAVLNNIIVGRVQAEIDTLQAQIAEYRKDRIEPTKLEQEEEEEPEHVDP